MESGRHRWSAVSRHIIFSIALEIVTVGAVLFWLAGLNAWSSLGAALAVIVLIRIVIAVMSFIIGWWFRSPSSTVYALSTGQYLYMVLREILSFLGLFFFFHALEPLLNEHDAGSCDESDETVLLFVHGFFSNAGFWVVFKRYFASHGLHALYTINLDPEFASMDDYAEQLAARVEQICAAHQRRPLVLVGHSMGGLVCRAYVDRYGSERVRQVITLGSPHHGTVLAYLLWGPNLKQMRPGSAWLSRLNAKASSVPISTHYSVHDNIIAPQTSACLPGAKAFVINGVGHLSMAFSRGVMAGVLEDIRSKDKKT